MGLYTPDRTIVAALQRIDPGLSVEWWDDRWHVFHNLPHHGNVDASARALARETYYDYRTAGRLVPYHVCLLAAYRLIEQEQLVLTVAEPDGAYRPLDHRVVDHLRRLDWQRRNWWVSDYLRHARTQGDENQRAQRERTDELWTTLRSDISGYVNRHNHSFSASALESIRRREQHDQGLLAAS